MDELKSDKINLEFYIGMAAKWYWVVLIPLAIAMVVGIYLVLFSQRYYESRTVILVQPQKLPSDVVRDIVAEDINTRVSTLSQRIQSRTNLEKIIADFQLFSGEKSKGMFMEDKVAILRKRISVKMTNGRNRNADSFAVTYRGTDPVRVTKITQSLASYIIDENLKFRENQVLGTHSFLEDELESMRKKLVETETGLKEYRERFMGGLPEQLNSNLRILESLHERLAHVEDELRASKYRRDSVLQMVNRPSVPEGQDSGWLDEDELKIQRLREELSLRLKRYTEYHPDVLQLQATIEKLEQQQKDGTHSPGVPVQKRRDPVYERQRREIQAEIALYEKDQKALQDQIAVYKKRVEDTPKREQELLTLQRDYDNIRGAYHSLLGRQLEAQIAVNMEKKQKGEQFRIIDPARVPQKPVQPDMKKLMAFVMAAGLGVGCALVALLEFFLQTFRGAGAVESATSFPVIATIPVIHGAGGRKRRLLKRLAPVAGGALTFSLMVVFIGLGIIKG